jgi:hypothetical protein
MNPPGNPRSLALSGSAILDMAKLTLNTNQAKDYSHNLVKVFRP